MRKQRDDWEQVRFFRWLDQARPKAGYPHDSALAEAAGISHSTLSNWRNGKQRPTHDKLTSLAAALDEEPSKLWRLAGLLVDDTTVEEPPAGPELRDDDERELWALLVRARVPDDVAEAQLRIFRATRRPAVS